jgi:hypothetical protein
MELPVFSDTAGKLRVQISHPALKSIFTLAAPLLQVNDPILRSISDTMVVPVRFKNAEYVVPFLLIESLQLEKLAFERVGSLEENDSRNVLNNILDILGYD